MNIYKQTKTGNSQLLLIFSGWAASPEVFRQLETEPDTDLWICYDYRGMDFEGEAPFRIPENPTGSLVIRCMGRFGHVW